MKTIFIFIVLLFFPRFAAAENFDDEQFIQIVTENYPPYQYFQNKELTGLSVEVVKMMLIKLGLNIEISMLPFARAYKKATTEKNILIFSLARTPDREHFFKWVGMIAPAHNCLFALKERADITITKLDAVSQYNIGAVREDVMEQYLKERSFVVTSNSSHESNQKMLFSRRIDLWAVDELTAYFILRKNNNMSNQSIKKILCLEETSPGGVYLAFGSLTDDAIVEKFRKALAAIKENGFYNAILKKYEYSSSPR